jgi:hypothetical protein
MKNYVWLHMVRLKVGFSRRILFQGPQHITFLADPQGLQDMMNKAMHQTMIDQSTILVNTIQNCLTEMLKKGTEEGYVGLAYFQPGRSPLMFPKAQSPSQPIDDPTVGVTPSPQINAIAHDTSSNYQPIQNQSIGYAPKNPTITVPIVQTYLAQSNV